MKSSKRVSHSLDDLRSENAELEVRLSAKPDLLLVLLPGMHGTPALFDGFERALPPNQATLRLAYPSGAPYDYASLAAWLPTQLPDQQDYVLLAESFAGPLAISHARERPPKLKGLVLVATFLRSPVPTWLKYLPDAIFAMLPTRSRIPRILLAGLRREQTLDQKLSMALHSVSLGTFLGRVRTILGVDVRTAAAQLALPVLYLQAESDWVVPARHGKEVEAAIRQAKRISLPGAHLLLQTNPDQSAAVILPWMNTVCA